MRRHRRRRRRRGSGTIGVDGLQDVVLQRVDRLDDRRLGAATDSCQVDVGVVADAVVVQGSLQRSRVHLDAGDPVIDCRVELVARRSTLDRRELFGSNVLRRTVGREDPRTVAVGTAVRDVDLLRELRSPVVLVGHGQDDPRSRQGVDGVLVLLHRVRFCLGFRSRAVAPVHPVGEVRRTLALSRRRRSVEDDVVGVGRIGVDDELRHRVVRCAVVLLDVRLVVAEVCRVRVRVGVLGDGRRAGQPLCVRLRDVAGGRISARVMSVVVTDRPEREEDADQQSHQAEEVRNHHQPAAAGVQLVHEAVEAEQQRDEADHQRPDPARGGVVGSQAQDAQEQTEPSEATQEDWAEARLDLVLSSGQLEPAVRRTSLEQPEAKANSREEQEDDELEVRHDNPLSRDQQDNRRTSEGYTIEGSLPFTRIINRKLPSSANIENKIYLLQSKQTQRVYIASMQPSLLCSHQ